MVLAKIFRSSHRDHSSKYFKSSSIHCSNPIELRPCTCHRQVIPGRILNRLRCQSWLNPSTSRTGSGLGPTRLMSPFSTLSSCGNSSMLLRRKYLPIVVILGSFLILKTGPEASFLAFSRASNDSAPTTIVRTFHIGNRPLFVHTRSPQKNPSPLQ